MKQFLAGKAVELHEIKHEAPKGTWQMVSPVNMTMLPIIFDWQSTLNRYIFRDLYGLLLEMAISGRPLFGRTVHDVAASVLRHQGAHCPCYFEK